MLTDSGRIPEGTSLKTDLCIVGAGPAGIALALELIGARCDVVILDAGGDWRETESQAIAKGARSESRYPPLEQTRRFALGGTSNSWLGDASWSPDGGLRSRPLEPVDFERRTWMPNSGWPFGYDEIEPYYRRAQALCRLGAFDYGAPAPLDGVLRLSGTRLQTTLFRFAAKGAFKGPLDALQAAERISVITHSRALQIETRDRAGQVTNLRVHGSSGEFSVSAKLFVLAAGGIENARLLLASNETFPNGLGNGHDLVGRFFMDHLVLRRGEIVPASSAFYRDIDLFRRRRVDGIATLPGLSLREDVRQAEGLPGVILSPVVGNAAFMSESFRALTSFAYNFRTRQRPPALAAGAWRIVRDPLSLGRVTLARLTRSDLKRPRFLGIDAHLEPLPRPENRITLSDERDAHGARRARVTWRAGKAEEEALRRTLALVDEELRAASIGRIRFGLPKGDFERLLTVTHHHMGTTRMHRDEKHGVVDENGRLHSVMNLFVAGSSVMPTAGAATVTLTLVALSIRLADHLKGLLAETPSIGGATT